MGNVETEWLNVLKRVAIASLGVLSGVGLTLGRVYISKSTLWTWRTNAIFCAPLFQSHRVIDIYSVILANIKLQVLLIYWNYYWKVKILRIFIWIFVKYLLELWTSSDLQEEQGRLHSGSCMIIKSCFINFSWPWFFTIAKRIYWKRRFCTSGLQRQG